MVKIKESGTFAFRNQKQMAISFSGISSRELGNRKGLKIFLTTLVSAEGFEVQELHYQFCSADEMIAANNQFLQHNYLTDIITFDLSSTVGVISADLLICPDMVRQNSLDENVSFNDELHRVIFHGVLHLCGYKDKAPRDTQLMRSKEDYYLAQYFSSDSSMS